MSPGATVDITGQLADALEVVGGPVDRGVAVGAELLRIRHAREASVRRGRDRGARRPPQAAMHMTDTVTLAGDASVPNEAVQPVPSGVGPSDSSYP